jgi:transposase
MEHSPEHPGANRHGYVLQHRLVAEAVLGRFLSRLEVVHHEDNDPSNNDPSNLWLFPSQREHLLHHKRSCPVNDRALVERLRAYAQNTSLTILDAARLEGMSRNTIASILGRHRILWHGEERLDEQTVREALAGRSTLEAAKLLDVHHQTLRNNFPHLLSKRVSPGSLEPHREEIRSLASTMHAKELAPRYGVCPATLREAVRRWKSQEPDAWSAVAAFQADRRLSGGGRPRRSSAERQSPR